MRKFFVTLLALILISCGSESSTVDVSVEPTEPVAEESTTSTSSTTTTIFVEEPFAVDEFGIELIEMGSEMKEQFDSLVSFVEKRTGLKFTEYPKYQLYTLNGYQEYNAVSYLDDFDEDYEEGEWERAVLSENMWGLTEATPDQMKNLLVEFQRCASAGHLSASRRKMQLNAELINQPGGGWLIDGHEENHDAAAQSTSARKPKKIRAPPLRPSSAGAIQAQRGVITPRWSTQRCTRSEATASGAPTRESR